MANVTVNASVSNINVTTTRSNITVTEDGSFITNIAVQESNVVVGVVDNIINVAEIAAISTADVRAALSNTAPILYDPITGVIGIDEAALFSGKTTDDLAEGNTNLYYTNARVNAYVIAAGLNFNAEKVDDRVANLMQTTGNLTFTYNDAANTLTLSQSLQTQDIVEGTNLYFSNARVLSAITNGNVQLKQFQETYYNIGTTNGNVAVNLANGTIQEVTLNGNITGLTFSNFNVGATLTLLIKQDTFGFRQLITTSGWGLWKFVDNYTTLSGAANAYDALTVMWDGTNYYGSLVNFSAGTIGDITAVTAGAGLTGGGSSGDVTLNVGAGVGITVNADNVAVNMSAFSTTDLAEGANLYFTTGRANSAIDNRLIGGTGISYSAGTIALDFTEFNTDNIVEGTSNLWFSNARVNSAIANYQGVINTTGNITGGYLFGNGAFLTGVASPYGNSNVQQYLALGFGSNNINTTGNITAGYFIGDGSQLTGLPQTLTNAQVIAYISTQPLTVGGNLDVNGNINATGNINYQNVTDLYVTDQKITLNSNAATNANVEIISNRPTATNTMLKWNEHATRWEFTNNGTTYYPIATSTTDLAEGSNLWFTTARANSAIDNRLVGGTGISYNAGTIALDFTEFNTGNIAEGANLWYTTARANTAIAAYQGNINTAGNITGGYLFGNGENLTGIVKSSDYPIIKIAPGAFSLGSNVLSSGAKISTTGTIEAGTKLQTPIIETATITGRNYNLSQDIDLTINANTNVNINANVVATGNVQAQYFKGNGSLLTGIASAYGDSNVTALLSNLGSNAISSTANITTTANVQADYFIGNFIGNLISTSTNVDVDLDFGTFTSNTDVQVAIDFGTF